MQGSQVGTLTRPPRKLWKGQGSPGDRVLSERLQSKSKQGSARPRVSSVPQGAAEGQRVRLAGSRRPSGRDPPSDLWAPGRPAALHLLLHPVSAGGPVRPTRRFPVQPRELREEDREREEAAGGGTPVPGPPFAALGHRLAPGAPEWVRKGLRDPCPRSSPKRENHYCGHRPTHTTRWVTHPPALSPPSLPEERELTSRGMKLATPSWSRSQP